MDIQISQETCCECSLVYWITEEHYQKLRKSKETFYCPNGHSQFYAGDSDAQKAANLKEQLRQEKRCSESLARSNSALRGVITRNKRK